MNRKLGWFLASGLLVALVLAGVVSNFASSSPDGLDATTLQGCTVDDAGTITGGECMARQAGEHQLKDSPLADYGIAGIDNPYLSTGLAGAAGVLLTFGLGAGLFWLVRRRTPAAMSPAAMSAAAPGDVDQRGQPDQHRRRRLNGLRSPPADPDTRTCSTSTACRRCIASLRRSSSPRWWCSRFWS